MILKKIILHLEDSSGFIFKYNNVIYRQINNSYKDNYNFLLSSGLYEELVKKKYYYPTKTRKIFSKDKNCFKILKPTQLKHITFPSS